MNDSLKIGIVSLNALPAVYPIFGRAIGGLENCAWLTARSLAGRARAEVSFIVRHGRALPDNSVDVVNLVPLIERLRNVRHAVSQSMSVRHRWPFVEVNRPTPSLLWNVPLLAASWLFRDRRPLDVRLEKLLSEIDCGVVLTFGVSSDTAAVVRASRRINRPVAVWLQSNTDLTEGYFDGTLDRSLYGESASECRFAVEHATCLISQTDHQQRELMRLVNRNSTVIQNPIQTGRWMKACVDRQDRNVVLWIGRYGFDKRPHLCLELAKKCPELSFEMIANSRDPEIEREIRANAPDNVRLIDYIPSDKMPAKLASARVLVFTGSAQIEGFPNVLLESAASATPVVSLDDFDGFIERSGCGLVSHGDLDRMSEQLRQLWNSDQEWKSCARSGREFICQNYDINDVALKCATLLQQLANSTPSNTPADR